MIKKKLISLSAIALSASLAAAGAANAGIIISGGSFGTIPDTAPENQIVTDIPDGNDSWDGYYGSEIVATGKLKVEFLGFEATAENFFSIEGVADPAFDTQAAAYLGENKVLPYGDSRPTGSPKPWDLQGVFPSFIVDVIGDLDFFFHTNRNGGMMVENGSNPDDIASPGLGINFFASCANSAKTECRHVTLFFDDDGGNNDDNHDDLVVRLSVLRGEVPVPAAMIPLLTALGGFGVVAARRNRKK